MKSQIAISSLGWGGRRHPPCAFTEQGAAMLSTVLRSDRGIQVNMEFMRAIVSLRQILASNTDLGPKLKELGEKYDTQFKTVFEANHQLMTPPQPAKKKIGFLAREGRAAYGSYAKGIPQPVVDILTKVYKTTITGPQVKETLIKMKFMLMSWSPEELKKKVQKEIDTTRGILKRVGLLQ